MPNSRVKKKIIITASGREYVAPPFRVRWKNNWKNYKYIYIMLLPVIAYYFVFHYASMGGAIIAFQNFKPAKGLFGSDWVGFKYFKEFLTSIHSWRVIRNTLLLNIYQIIFGFPVPIILALMLNEIKMKFFKKVSQTVSYMPHFISVVVVCGLLVEFCKSDGLFNDMLGMLGFSATNLLGDAKYFRTIYVTSGIWQTMGWGSIIYLATLSGVNPSLHEAAAIDGASKFKRMIHISFPSLVPVIVIQLIMRIGNLLTQGYEKVILLYTPLTYETADIISSYVYRRGLLESNYSFGAAVGIFNSIVNVIMLLLANRIARRYSETSLW